MVSLTILTTVALVACSSLPLLASHFLAEGIGSTSRALLLKVSAHRTARQAAEGVAVPSRLVGHVTVVDGRGQGSRIQLDALVLAAEQVARATASVALARAPHDVAELNAARLAIPKRDADKK